MKLFYVPLILLILVLRSSDIPPKRSIDPAKFSGNITLSLKHGVWRFWKETPVYQTVMIDLVCQASKCDGEAFAYAPRFNDKLEYLGKVEKVFIDQAWHLDIKIKYQQLFDQKSVNEAIYKIEIIPTQEGFLGSYLGVLKDHPLRGQVAVSVQPIPQLTSNIRLPKNKPLSAYILQPENIPISEYKIYRNLNYLTINNHQLLLDLYERKTNQPNPTLIYIHGGGWSEGSKPSVNFFWPYLLMGFSVVNIEYRLADVAPAPAAVEDCLCALYWLENNAKKYNFDLNKVVIMGSSAGGHLALMTAMVSESTTLLKNCPFKKDQKPKVAAVVNWFGVTDFPDLLVGKNQLFYAVNWLRKTPNPRQVSQLVSPLNYVSKNNPPILSIHGTDDSFVPYNHSLRLHESLTKLGVKNGLLTLFNRDHGDFTQGEMRQIYLTIESFLRANQILDH